MPVIAITERLIIRPWVLEDTGALQILTCEPGLADFSISGYSNFSSNQAQEWIENEIARFEKSGMGKFAIVRKETGKIIGISGLFAMPNPYATDIELNYRYPTEVRGNGFAYEAANAILKYGFCELNLNEINAIIDPRNLPSSRLAQKLGFNFVETIKYLGLSENRWKLARNQ